MKNQTDGEVRSNSTRFMWWVLFVFALAIILTCGFVFLFNYENAYDNDLSGYIPPSFGVVFRYFVIAIISIVAAVVLKIFFKKRLRLWALLICAILLPIILYHFNYHTLKKDGPLHFLVDKGGIFHFIAIGDYNFDGMNDEQYHIMYDERKVSTGYASDGDNIIHYINTKAIGTGPQLSAFCFYDYEDSVITLHLNRDGVEYKKVEITVTFYEPTYAKNVSFYLDHKEFTNTIVSERTVTLVFDAVTCENWQNSSDRDSIEIPIDYVVFD